MPDRNMSVNNFPNSTSCSTLPSSFCDNEPSLKTLSSDEELYEASLHFLRQHLKRKSEYDLISNSKVRKYSDTLLFEFDGDRRRQVTFLKLHNVDEFDKLRKLENGPPERTLSATDVLPTVKKQRSNFSNLFSKSRRHGTSSKSSGFLSILRKLSPNCSKEDLQSKCSSEEMGTSQSPTITSNSSFPSTEATIPSSLLNDPTKTAVEESPADNTSTFIVTNVWPRRNFKSPLPDIEESPRRKAPKSTDEPTPSNDHEGEDLTLSLTFKNDHCHFQNSNSDSDTDDRRKVRKISSKLSVGSEQSAQETVQSDDEYSEWSTDSEEIEQGMLSPTEAPRVQLPQEQIRAIFDDLVTQLQKRNVTCAYDSFNK